MMAMDEQVPWNFGFECQILRLSILRINAHCSILKDRWKFFGTFICIQIRLRKWPRLHISLSNIENTAKFEKTIHLFSWTLFYSQFGGIIMLPWKQEALLYWAKRGMIGQAICRWLSCLLRICASRHALFSRRNSLQQFRYSSLLSFESWFTETNLD